MTIDKLELEEILGDYYDFSDWEESDWERANKEIEAELERRGIEIGADTSMEDLEEYWKICDGVCGRIMCER